MASYAKDLTKVFDAIRDQDPGVRIERTAKGHWVVKPGDRSRPMVHLPGTPSDHRSWLNAIKQLERTGGYDLRRFRR